MFRIIIAGLIGFFTVVVAAKEPCGQLLSVKQPSVLDFRVSDLEGLYLEIVKDAIELDKIEFNLQRFERFVNMKAQLLNRLISISHSLRDGAETDLPLHQIYMMVSSLGVDPAKYGLVSELGTVKFVLPVDQSSPSTSSTLKKNPIGFIYPPAEENDGEEVRQGIGFLPIPRDENDVQPKRSIGFFPLEVRKPDPLPRKIGQLRIGLAKNGQTVRVIDPNTNLQYVAPADIMLVKQAWSEDRAFQLAFDAEDGEWILSFENLANPEGKVGFQFPESDENS